MAILNPQPVETLGDRAVIELRGNGVLSFLHNVLTCSVENLNQHELAYGTLLSPQGKILHDVFIHLAAENLFLDCDAGQREALIGKLKLYRLRAKFEILPREDLHVEVGGDGTTDPRHADLGARAIAAGSGSGEAAQYHVRRFGLGIADSAEIGSGKLFPHEANFDLLHAVDFTKGCYIGQEVVSRMQHRGTARSRILPVVGKALAKGSAIASGEKTIGEILSAEGEHALALIRLDRLAEATAPLVSNSVVVKVLNPGWIKYDVTIPQVAQ